MKSLLFGTSISDSYNSLVIFCQRIIWAALAISHGFDKMTNFSKLSGHFPAYVINSEISLMLVIFAELVAPMFLIVGLMTRFFALIMFIPMLVAIYHDLPNGFMHYTLPMAYAAGYLLIFLTGAGSLSIDRTIYKR